MKCDRNVTVSYTHLDVYKRQAQKAASHSLKTGSECSNPGTGYPSCALQLRQEVSRFAQHLSLIHILAEHSRSVPLVTAPDFGERAHQPFKIPFPISHRDVGEDVADVAEFHLNVVFIPQNVVHFDSRKPQVKSVDRQLGDVKVKNRVPIDEFAGIGVIVADLVDFLPRVLRERSDLVENLLPVDRKVFPGNIEA